MDQDVEEYGEEDGSNVEVVNQQTLPEIPDNELHEASESPNGDPDQFCTDMNVDELSCQNQ